MFLGSQISNAQTPPIEAGVSRELARWRAAHYGDVRYKLNLTLEKMSPTLKGTIEISLKTDADQIILDWRKIKGKEQFAGVSNANINGIAAKFEETNEHLVFKEGVKMGENVIKLDFTSPIATSGAAVTRYVDKEDGAEYIYSLFVPSDASTAFPVFDQPDLKARFKLLVVTPMDLGWSVVSNTKSESFTLETSKIVNHFFEETQPISTYVFAFAAGDFAEFDENKIAALSRESGVDEVARRETSGTPKKNDYRAGGAEQLETSRTFGAPQSSADLSRRFTSGYLLDAPPARIAELQNNSSKIYVRKSQAEKFKQHAAETFRLNREAVKYLESYFDYKFPFPKYDLVLIPEFPFGGMEHAGATFLRESSVIFPQEPTANDYISRGNLIFHEAAHQWFGDTVTMRWFDDLWLKEGFAEFMAYKTMEKVLPQYNAWKAFYERNKPLAYLTDSTRGTTPIYQEIPNLSSAKSAYGNIVYRKAPSFLKQAEFYLGADKFQSAVRAFLKQNAFKNAEWQDLVKSFEAAIGQDLKEFSESWVRQRGLIKFRIDKSETENEPKLYVLPIRTEHSLEENSQRVMKSQVLIIYQDGTNEVKDFDLKPTRKSFSGNIILKKKPVFIFPNYQDYGYGIFLLDEQSRNYVLADIQNEKDDFLRSMMWGALWDSVREAELNPKDYVELAVKNISGEKDELTIQTILSRVSTAMNYYLGEKQSAELAPRLEKVLLERINAAETLGHRIVFYRAFLNLAASAESRQRLKEILTGKFEIQGLKLKTKDKFDIVARLLILNDADASKLLEDLAKTETSDEAKRYAYAARAGIATAENKGKFFADFLNNKEISESYIESAAAPFNSVRHAEMTLPFLEKALAELPNLKRTRKIFFVNNWLGAFIGGQRSEQALAIVNKFVADNPNLDRDLRLKILENVDGLERSVKIRKKFAD
ncbi:MAG TPA: M1 family aminopeptidase [Pyrinomonadaceae bacterium]|jgi:aminopeptidase N